VVQRQPRRGRARSEKRGDGLRFAFYGRTSTEDYQDRAPFEYWQRDVAENVISGRGVVVAEFFDSRYSRRLPWVERPEAAALLDAVADPDRGFDAIVVGEFERAFYGDQLQRLMPVFDRYRVDLWLPETDGPLDMDDVLSTSSWKEYGRHRSGVEREGSAVSVACGSGAEQPPQW
jgi:hypothetical protein